MRKIIGCLVGLAVYSCVSWGDTLTLTDGKTLTGEIGVFASGQLLLKTPQGETRYDISGIKSFRVERVTVKSTKPEGDRFSALERRLDRIEVLITQVLQKMQTPPPVPYLPPVSSLAPPETLPVYQGNGMQPTTPSYSITGKCATCQGSGKQDCSYCTDGIERWGSYIEPCSRCPAGDKSRKITIKTGGGGHRTIIPSAGVIQCEDCKGSGIITEYK